MTNEDLLRVLRDAESALASCYQVADYPGDGSSRQDDALRLVRFAITELQAADHYVLALEVVVADPGVPARVKSVAQLALSGGSEINRQRGFTAEEAAGYRRAVEVHFGDPTLEQAELHNLAGIPDGTVATCVATSQKLNFLDELTPYEREPLLTQPDERPFTPSIATTGTHPLDAALHEPGNCRMCGRPLNRTATPE